jgi:hypothetical protein
MGRRNTAVSKIHLTLFPPDRQKQIELWVEQILAIGKELLDVDVSELGGEELVYELYGFTEEEIDIVEGASR